MLLTRFQKAEKQVKISLDRMSVVSFLPLQKVTRIWSDRKKQLELPLFPNYIFIYTSSRDRYKSLQIKSILNYVSFAGKPATVPENVIVSLQKILSENIQLTEESFSSDTIGMPVLITEGPFTGIEGI
jgi:transcription antitermination factor NusG